MWLHKQELGAGKGREMIFDLVLRRMWEPLRQQSKGLLIIIRCNTNSFIRLVNASRQL